MWGPKSQNCFAHTLRFSCIFCVYILFVLFLLLLLFNFILYWIFLHTHPLLYPSSKCLHSFYIYAFLIYLFLVNYQIIGIICTIHPKTRGVITFENMLAGIEWATPIMADRFRGNVRNVFSHPLRLQPPHWVDVSWKSKKIHARN